MEARVAIVWLKGIVTGAIVVMLLVIWLLRLSLLLRANPEVAWLRSQCQS